MKNKPTVPVVIPSMDRADSILSNQLVANCIICVPESQAAAYREHNAENEILAHPDNVIGLPRKRQWIIDHFDSVFMLDDDATEFRYLFYGAGEGMPKFTPEENWNAIQNLYLNACDIDAALFSFNNVADPRKFNCLNGFKFSGFVFGQCLGVRNAKEKGLYFDTRYYTADDYWISLYNAHKNRFIYKDCRWGLVFKKTGYLPGGNSRYRNVSTEKSDFELLIKHFGTKVIRPKGSNTLAVLNSKSSLRTKEEIEGGYAIRAGIKIDGNKIARHDFEKSVFVPF